MNGNEPKVPDSLRAKFPDLRPIKRHPPLTSLNGIGFTMYGRRDVDEETGTYVKTHCFCLLFVPLFAFGAYRVADADRGWYFLGKDRLSSFAKSCNFGVLLLSLMLAGILVENSYKSSPDFRAKVDLKRAAQALQSGDSLRAAALYRDVAQGTVRVDDAKRGLHDSLEQCLASENPDKIQGAYRMLAALPRSFNSPTPLIANAYPRGLALVDKFRNKNPEASLDLLRQLEPLSGTNAPSLLPLEIELLKDAIAARPDNTNRVVELALVYEDQTNMDACYQLLSPYRDKLGSTEGARILGQHLISQGEYGGAYGLLYPYVQANLERLRTVERHYTNALAVAEHNAVQYLQNGQAERSFYENYKVASKQEQSAMVDAFIEKWMRDDPGLKRAIAEFKTANKIVPVTLDLGIVQLNRAQNLTDPAARKSELEAAEKTFLAIRGMAGKTDEYRMFLGQVYYWLGRSAEGKDLFDQLLAAHKRDYQILMEIAGTLREVGDDSQARDLVEEGYRNAKRDRDKFEAASLRSRLPKNAEDQIAWLEKSDPNNAVVQIELNSARGEKALLDGNRDQAAQFLRKAIAGYQREPQNSATLNNSGLVYLDLYRVTGDIKDNDQGLSLLEQAIALTPGNSVLLINITSLLITRAHMDLVGDAIHFDALKDAPDATMLLCLYADETQRTQVYQRLQQNQYMKKALAYLDKSLLLAPKSSSLYVLSLSLQAAFRNLPELQKLQQRLDVAKPDLSETVRLQQEAYTGTKDKQRIDHTQKEIRRFEDLVQSPDLKAHAPTLELAEIRLNTLRQSAAQLGVPVDSRQVLNQAMAIEQQLPNCASRATLAAAYFFRANDELKQQSPDYAKIADAMRHSLGPRELIAFLLEQNGPLSTLIRQNANVLKALDLMKAEARRFPSFRQVDEWALFKTIDPAETAAALRQIKDDKTSRLAGDLAFQLNPMSSSAALDQYWLHRMDGDDAGANLVYTQAAKQGVPLPPL